MDCKEKLPSALMKGYSRKFEKGLESMSPFEIKNKLIEFAEAVSYTHLTLPTTSRV